MKKYCLQILFMVGCFAFSLQTQAQVDSAKAVKLQAQLIDSICGCMSKSDPAKVKTIEDVQNVMLQCSATGNIQLLFMQYAMASGINLTDTEKLQEVMQSFSMDLAMKCPAMMTIMMNIAKDPEEMKKLTEQYNKVETMPTEPTPVVPQKN